MNKRTEPMINEWNALIHKAAVQGDHAAFKLAAEMRNFNTCSILRLAIVADQLKKYRGY